jgi:Cof subfamily protein (haloacid dehalogenase superfamily)
MSIRLVATDLDGTLLNSQRQLSEVTLAALAAAAARGVQFAVVTGRRVHSAQPLLRQIPCPLTLIASNGALIVSPSGEVIHQNFLPRLVAREVLQITPAHRPYAVLIFDCPAHGQIVMQQNAAPEGPLGWYQQYSPKVVEMVADLESALVMDPVQIMFGGPPALIEPVETALLGSPVCPKIHLTWTKYFTRNISLLDVMNHTCSKGRTLALWAERCGIDASEVMAVGDNFNDLEMLQYAGLPVLMANATPGLARDGWAVTLSNDEDGVAAAIETYVLQKEP